MKYILLVITSTLILGISGCKKETDLKSPFEEMKSQEGEKMSDHEKMKRDLMDGNNKDYYK